MAKLIVYESHSPLSGFPMVECGLTFFTIGEQRPSLLCQTYGQSPYRKALSIYPGLFYMKTDHKGAVSHSRDLFIDIKVQLFIDIKVHVLNLVILPNC